MKNKDNPIRICVVCGKQFTPHIRRLHKKTCCPACETERVRVRNIAAHKQKRAKSKSLDMRCKPDYNQRGLDWTRQWGYRGKTK